MNVRNALKERVSQTLLNTQRQRSKTPCVDHIDDATGSMNTGSLIGTRYMKYQDQAGVGGCLDRRGRVLDVAHEEIAGSSALGNGQKGSDAVAFAACDDCSDAEMIEPVPDRADCRVSVRIAIRH